MQVANPCEAGDEDATAYEDGDDAELVFSIVNGSREDDRLTAIQGEAFDGVYVDEVPTGSTAPRPRRRARGSPSPCRRAT